MDDAVTVNRSTSLLRPLATKEQETNMDAENDFLLHVYGACLINEFTRSHICYLQLNLAWH